MAWKTKYALALKILDWFYAIIIVEDSASQPCFSWSQVQLRMSVHFFLIDIFLENFVVIVSTLYANKTPEIVP